MLNMSDVRKNLGWINSIKLYCHGTKFQFVAWNVKKKRKLVQSFIGSSDTFVTPAGSHGTEDFKAKQLVQYVCAVVDF